MFPATNYEGPVYLGVATFTGLATDVTTGVVAGVLLVVLVVTLVAATCVLLLLLAT